MGTLTDSELKAKLAQRYLVNPVTSCWDWTGYKTPKGYMTMNVGGVKYSVLRLVYKIYVAEPGFFFVFQRCGNSICVNPEHLYLRRSTNDALKIQLPEETWAKKIQRHRLYLSGEWMRPVYVAHDMGASPETIRQVMKRMAKANQLDRKLFPERGNQVYMYRRPVCRMLHSVEWRTISNEQLGIPDATWGWH